ncbi:MAG: peptidyl-prolyl cis-trans isomerase, partial [Deltaproteobacteria bacterium]|nr:peptidyl-prolyl cis-trans isomerase [Deltaproteobacteria bacterium]
VNGETITQGDMEQLLRQGNADGLSPDKYKEVLDMLIESELVRQFGASQGLDKNPAYVNSIKDMEQRLRAFKRREMQRYVYNQEVLAKTEVSEEDAKKFFEENKELLQTEWHLAGLSFRNPVEANAALKLLQEGKEFNEVAVETGHGKDRKTKAAPATAKDLGFLGWMRILPEWQEAVFALKPGEYTPILHGKRSGIRILKLLTKRKGEEPDFEKFKMALLRRLREAATEKNLENLKKDLRAKAKIEITGN